MTARGRLFVLSSFLLAASVQAASTIHATQRWSWSASAGWMNWRTDSTNGVVVGPCYMSGWIYSSTKGWMHAGDGSPTNGYRYGNNSTNDYGINLEDGIYLRGFAWSASSGWISFEWTNREAASAPKIDLLTGNMSGLAWSASLGWISLSNMSAKVRTVTMDAGTVAPNGIPVAWQSLMTGGTNVLLGGSADYDNDTVSDYDEYVAGTHPTNPASRFEIGEVQIPVSTNMLLKWWMEEGRLYQVETNADLMNSNAWQAMYLQWINSGTGGWYEAQLDIPEAATSYYYRVRVKLPLSQ